MNINKPLNVCVWKNTWINEKRKRSESRGKAQSNKSLRVAWGPSGHDSSPHRKRYSQCFFNVSAEQYKKIMNYTKLWIFLLRVPTSWWIQCVDGDTSYLFTANVHNGSHSFRPLKVQDISTFTWFIKPFLIKICNSNPFFFLNFGTCVSHALRSWSQITPGWSYKWYYLITRPSIYQAAMMFSIMLNA